MKGGHLMVWTDANPGPAYRMKRFLSHHCRVVKMAGQQSYHLPPTTQGQGYPLTASGQSVGYVADFQSKTLKVFTTGAGDLTVICTNK